MREREKGQNTVAVDLCYGCLLYIVYIYSCEILNFLGVKKNQIENHYNND